MKTLKPNPLPALIATLGALKNLTSREKMYPAKKWVQFADRKILHELVAQLTPLVDATIAEAQRIANRRGFLRGSAWGIGVGLTAIGVNALTQYLQSPTYWCGVVAGALCAALVIYASRRG